MFVNKVKLALLTGTAAFAAVGFAGTANAAQTAAGTVITNTATVNYTVNGTAQTAASNASTFVVDRKVNLTVVANQAANTQVNLGQTGAVLSFKVTNNTNGIQDFILAADQLVPVGIITGTDNFDATNLKVYVDSNGNGVYDAGVDTATFIDELAPDASAVVFVVGDIPTTPTNASLADVDLHVTVAAGGTSGSLGTALQATLLNTDTTVDVVFADDDDDGVLGLDAPRDGQGRAYLAYEIGTHNVNMTVTKSSAVISDGVNTLNPKAIPGATIQYCITVTNTNALTPATGVAITDTIPANTTYVPGSITVGGLGTGGVCVLNGVPVNDDGSTTGLVGGSYNDSTKLVTASTPTLLGLGSLAATFRVTIN